MLSVCFEFSLDEKVCIETIGFTGIVTMCAIEGEGEKVYYVQGIGASGWYSERLIKEVLANERNAGECP
jgi:hypothetical protein